MLFDQRLKFLFFHQLNYTAFFTKAAFKLIASQRFNHIGVKVKHNWICLTFSQRIFSEKAELETKD